MTRTLVALVLLLAACGDDRPPAPSAAQSDQLNEAEALLDAAANEEGPEDPGNPSK